MSFTNSELYLSTPPPSPPASQFKLPSSSSSSSSSISIPSPLTPPSPSLSKKGYLPQIKSSSNFSPSTKNKVPKPILNPILEIPPYKHSKDVEKDDERSDQSSDSSEMEEDEGEDELIDEDEIIDESVDEEEVDELDQDEIILDSPESSSSSSSSNTSPTSTQIVVKSPKKKSKESISLDEALTFRSPYIPQIGERVWISYQSTWVGGIVVRHYKKKKGLFIVNTFQNQELWVNPAFLRPWSTKT